MGGLGGVHGLVCRDVNERGATGVLELGSFKVTWLLNSCLALNVTRILEAGR